MKRGDKVLVWDEKKVKCLGWGKVVEILKDLEKIEKRREQLRKQLKEK